jgi:hypothetical protein
VNARAALRPLAIAPSAAPLSTPAPSGTLRQAAAPGVRLHIGSLSLHGVAPAQGRRIASAFERELGVLLARQPLLAQTLDMAALRLPPLQLVAGERPESTGRRLAQCVALQWQGGAP